MNQDCYRELSEEEKNERSARDLKWNVTERKRKNKRI